MVRQWKIQKKYSRKIIYKNINGKTNSMISLVQLLKEAQGNPKAIILAGAPGAGKGYIFTWFRPRRSKSNEYR